MELKPFAARNLKKLDEINYDNKILKEEKKNLEEDVRNY